MGCERAGRGPGRRVAKGAKVVAMDPKSGMRTLREGRNGFTCMPDEPSTPGPDPMCADQASLDFLHPLITHAAPPAGKVRINVYAGGRDGCEPHRSLLKETLSRGSLAQDRATPDGRGRGCRVLRRLPEESGSGHYDRP